MDFRILSASGSMLSALITGPAAKLKSMKTTANNIALQTVKALNLFSLISTSFSGLGLPFRVQSCWSVGVDT
jgi:hypothetical protein